MSTEDQSDEPSQAAEVARDLIFASFFAGAAVVSGSTAAVQMGVLPSYGIEIAMQLLYTFAGATLLVIGLLLNATRKIPRNEQVAT